MTTILEVNGEVLQALTLSLEDLRQQYPAYSVSTQFQNDDRTVDASFTGARLWDILQTAGLKPDATEKRRVMARASDSFRCLLRWHEIDPAVSESLILVAYEQDGQALTEKGGPLRLVVPGDEQGRRYLRGLALITVLDEATVDEE
jgi:DMSO/TMAO reductase YedYZ molybdopterin-dependent catalytic subunit